MDKRSRFSRYDKEYEVLQDGVEYVPENKRDCIRHQKDGKCISIQSAINGKLICEVIPPEKNGLFSNLQQQGPEISEQKIIAEYRPFEGTETPRIRLKDDNVYFMPVDQLRAQVFLGHGLIYPAAYDKLGLSVDFHDSQRQDPAKLTLYETPQPLNHDQLLLKILLRPDEIATAERNGDVLHLSIPLPISRLAGIEVSPTVKDLNRYINGWVAPDIPVPRHLFNHTAVQSVPDKEASDLNSQQANITPNPNIAEAILRFDRYLGMMAFLRNVGRYFSEKTGNYADYPDVFFSICEKIIGVSGLVPSGCPMPEPLLLALLDVETQIPPFAIPILSLVSSQDTQIDKETAHSCATKIYEDTGKKEALRQAFKLLFNVPSDYRSAITKLKNQELPIEAAVLAGLFNFSMRQSNDYRTVKQRLHEDWSDPTQVCPMLAALGAYYGYAALDAQETLYSVHPLIKRLVEEHSEIKFHLKTHFERQLIETLYQRAFFPDVLMQDSGTLFSTVIKPQASSGPQVPWLLLVADKSYSVRDLMVRQYEVTPIGQFIQRLMAWKRNTIDRQSVVGKCLMGWLCDYASEFRATWEEEKQTFRYSITKNKLIELIESGSITFEPEVLEFLEALIEKDNAR